MTGLVEAGAAGFCLDDHDPGDGHHRADVVDVTGLRDPAAIGCLCRAVAAAVNVLLMPPAAVGRPR